MQLSSSLRARTVAARSVARNALIVPRPINGAVGPSRRFVQRLVKAAEEEAAATATESASEEAAAAAAEDAVQPPPLERARAALEADPLDAAAVAAALADAEAELAALKDSLAAADAEAARAAALEGSLATSKDQYIRLQADFDNFRRRTAKEKEELSSKAKGDVVLGLLPLVDNFELARTQVKPETEGETKINNSYQGLYKQMVDILRGLGVEPVSTVGTPFDPEIHEAIAREASDDVPDGTVLQEFRKGFAMGERLLRPAMVQVSFTDKPADTPAAETADDAGSSSGDEQPAAAAGAAAGGDGAQQ